MSPDLTPLQSLDDLFPAPSLPPSPLSPQRFPGAHLESLVALKGVLKDNHQRYHIFRNERRYHNHVSHRALAIYALGGSADIIRAYYQRDSLDQRPAFESPGPITEDNFVDHVEDPNFYQAYMVFFSKQIAEKGVGKTLEEFIFSEKYNFRKGRDADIQPEMLNRFFSGFLHALIHVGHGVEFGLKGMVAEGLAMAAVHLTPVRRFLPPSTFVSDAVNGSENITSHPTASTLHAPDDYSTPLVSKTGGVHAFDIVALMLKDDRFIYKHVTRDQLEELLVEITPIIREHAERWTVNLNKQGEVERKMEELLWLSSLLYGVGGSQSGEFESDFFLMHLVTASLFLPSLIVYLSPRSQVLLLRAYFIIVLSMWVARGRPTLNIKSFMTTTSVEHSPITASASKAEHNVETTLVPNPFLPILQSALTHPDNHMIKIQRSFAHFDSIYGRRPAGYFAGTDLEGAELLDGSLFLRNALLTADFIGWVREGKKPQEFSEKWFQDVAP